MKLTDDNTALTHHADENGSESDIRISFDYHKYEKQRHDCPEQLAYVEITGIERMEPLAPYIMGWNEFHGETQEELINWECDIHEAINKQAADNANEDMSEGTIWGRGA